jgi:hypothetical protein
VTPLRPAAGSVAPLALPAPLAPVVPPVCAHANRVAANTTVNSDRGQVLIVR